MNKSIYIVLGVVVLAAVAGAAYVLGQQQNKQQFALSDLLRQPSMSVVGDITAIGQNSITVAATDGMHPGATTPAVVYIDSSTTIEKLIQRDPATVAAEMAVYQKQQAAYVPNATTTPPVPPLQVRSVHISLADLAVGEHVNAILVEPADIKHLTAVRISVLPDIAPISATSTPPGLPTPPPAP